MPKAPDFSFINSFAYISNYYLAGCFQPRWLVVDFVKEPALDLLLLFLIPDVEDIAQAIVDPRKAHNEKKGRHGTRRRAGFGIPDISELIGESVRAEVNPNGFWNISPTRKLFEIWNRYELVTFTYAIVDGVTDIWFANLYGMATVYPEHCVEFPRLARTTNFQNTVAGAGPPMTPVGLEVERFNTDFGDGVFGTTTDAGKWTITAKITVQALSIGTTVFGSLAFGHDSFDIVDESQYWELETGEIAHRELTYQADADEFIGWGISNRVGAVKVLDFELIAFKDIFAF